ncbi:MAG: CCA tRNA nucleotidyltransferase [Alphaproteobacteria bacterium]|nr:CCA tRNA nucleotidyltransferase [Alphaproteobacteria bacterium]
MKPAQTLTPQDWLQSAPLQKVLAVLNEGAPQDDPNALLVGGCVRNALLGQTIDDIDIATRLTPDEVIARMDAAGIKTIPTGIDHGTITAVEDGQPFEITTLRRDVETDGRRAIVAYSTDWAEDARRRDFTINTLLADVKGRVYDPLGEGLKDIQARRVVFVGEPAQRIAEDHLRILRYFRFHALYGAGNMDPEALEACEAAADKIPSLSKERITQEIFKILSHDDPAGVLSVMAGRGILTDLPASGYNPQLLKDLCFIQKQFGLRALPARLLVLGGLKAEGVLTLERYLLIPKLYKKDMAAIEGVLALADLNEEQAIKEALYRYGRTPTAQALMIEIALDRVMRGGAGEALNLIRNWDIPTFPVSGEDLIKQGYKPGPELGQKVIALEAEWIKGGFRNLC